MLGRRRVLLTSIFVLAAVAIGLTAYRVRQSAQEAIDESAAAVRGASSVSLQVKPVSPVTPPAGFKIFPVRGEFRALARFGGEWMVVNRATLFRYDNQGRLLQTWRVGLELPATQLVGLAVRRGIPQEELWIATDGAGVLIWDRQSMRQLLPETPAQRKVVSLLPLPDGKMLLGTLAAGLWATDGQQLSLFREELKSAEISALAMGATSEEIWIGTRGQGVWLWRAGTLNHFLDELPDAQVTSLYANAEGAWVGTPNGVGEFVNGQFRRKLAVGALASGLAERAGKLWISTVDEGTFSVDLQAKMPRLAAGAQRGERMSGHTVALLATEDGVVALGDSELRLLPEGRELMSAGETGLTASHVSALAEDQQGHLWVGYFDRGLDVLPAGAEIAKHTEDDVLFCVNRIKDDKNEARMLVATANGLVVFDRNGQPRKILTTRDGLISNNVTDVLPVKDTKGANGLVAATGAGLTFMNSFSVESVYAFQGLVNNHVYTIAQNGAMFVAGTLGGVSFLQNTAVQTSLTTANSELPQNWITGSVIDGGDLYLGTYGSGVVRLNGRHELQNFREFGHSRVEINANALVNTPQAVYAGTAGQGLAIFDKTSQRWRFWSTGLPSANVTAVAADGFNLYIGTDNGLVKISEKALTL